MSLHYTFRQAKLDIAELCRNPLPQVDAYEEREREKNLGESATMGSSEGGEDRYGWALDLKQKKKGKRKCEGEIFLLFCFVWRWRKRELAGEAHIIAVSNITI